MFDWLFTIVRVARLTQPSNQTGLGSDRDAGHTTISSTTLLDPELNIL